MIVVDSSVLVAIVLEEPNHEQFETFIAQGPSVIGTPTVVETKMVLSHLPVSQVDEFFGTLGRGGSLSQVDFTTEMAEAAVEAFRRYGKGQGHPAQLNFGDCMSYGVAKTLRAALLFKGNDFALTDIEPALP